jgi:hypothetical protein
MLPSGEHSQVLFGPGRVRQFTEFSLEVFHPHCRQSSEIAGFSLQNPRFQSLTIAPTYSKLSIERGCVGRRSVLINQSKIEKINLKRWHFFTNDLMSSFSPRSPRIAPHLTTIKPQIATTVSQKPPQKRISTTQGKNIAVIASLHQTIMESPTPPPEKRPAFSSPLMFFIVLGIIVASIALFLIFRPNPSGRTPQSNTPATQQ